MKTNKLLAAGALALSMAMTPVASLLNAMPIAAADVTQTVVNNTTNHSYDAYQIFKGTQAADSPALGDVDWGTGIKGSEFLEELKKDNATKVAFASASNPADVATILAANTTLGNDFARIAEKHLTDQKTSIAPNEQGQQTLDSGYYLMKDVTEFSPNETDTYKNLSLLQVTNNEITIKAKNGVPTVEKKVSDEPASGTGSDVFLDEADHEIGETFQFKLTATIDGPDEMSAYKTYKMIFNDEVSSGVTIGELVSVNVNNKPITDSTKYTYVKNGNELTVTIPDVVELLGEGELLKNAKVEVIYNASLNGNAAITDKDHTTLANTNKVSLQYSNNPNYQGDGDLGKTPEDTVFVGTYELPALKTDNGETPKNLEGAEFKLQSDKSKKWAIFDTNGKITSWVDDENSAGKITSGADGTFKATGLDAGKYILKETKAPAGYNTPANPFEIFVVAEHDGIASKQDEATVSKIKFKIDTNGTEGDQITIQNSKSGSLPETGGMGTTMIYGVGAVMVAGAAVFYVTNKRTRKD